MIFESLNVTIVTLPDRLTLMRRGVAMGWSLSFRTCRPAEAPWPDSGRPSTTKGTLLIITPPQITSKIWPTGAAGSHDNEDGQVRPLFAGPHRRTGMGSS